ncbi:MAG: FeoA family protein [Acutalibacteraceae bacterium]|jgi:ferrous iron transport protein A
MRPIPLSALTPGQTASVCRVSPESRLQRRLLDIGLIEHTPVTCLQVSPGGDPVAYGIRGAVIALRREDAAGVLVWPQKEAATWPQDG